MRVTPSCTCDSEDAGACRDVRWTFNFAGVLPPTADSVLTAHSGRCIRTASKADQGPQGSELMDQVRVERFLVGEFVRQDERLSN